MTNQNQNNTAQAAQNAIEWATTPGAVENFPATARAHINGLASLLLSKLRAPVADVSNIAGQLWDDAIACDWSSFRERVVSALASAPVAGEAQERIEQMAVNRYRPVPDGKFSYKVVAGDGSRSLYTGTKDSCLRVAAKLTEAFLDGAFVASDASPQSSKDGEHGE